EFTCFEAREICHERDNLSGGPSRGCRLDPFIFWSPVIASFSLTPKVPQQGLQPACRWPACAPPFESFDHALVMRWSAEPLTCRGQHRIARWCEVRARLGNGMVRPEPPALR